jgi:hypothetical protein
LVGKARGMMTSAYMECKITEKEPVVSTRPDAGSNLPGQLTHKWQ